MKIVHDFAFSVAYNLLTAKHNRSRWENLDRGQYRFQPIKFVNLVVPSPCETEPYNQHINDAFLTIFRRFQKITQGFQGTTDDILIIQQYIFLRDYVTR